MNKVLFYLLFMIMIGMSCGDIQNDAGFEVANSLNEMQDKVDGLSKKLDSNYNRVVQTVNKSDSNFNEGIIYSNVKATTKYLDSLRWEMNRLNPVDKSNMEIVRQEYHDKRGFDSVLTKVTQTYLLISNATQNDKNKIVVDSIVTDLNQKFKNVTFDGFPSVAMSSILFDIEEEVFIKANNYFEMK